MNMYFALPKSEPLPHGSAQLWHPGCERERLQLSELGAKAVSHVPRAQLTFKNWLNAVARLNEAACTTFSAEAALASLTTEFRRLWLTVAHEASDLEAKLTSPGNTQTHFRDDGETEPIALENRCTANAQKPIGWCSEHVLFSSAQGALASILLWAQEESFWCVDQSAHLTFAGASCETKDLLDVLRTTGLSWSEPGKTDPVIEGTSRPSRVILIEPVFFDEGVNVFNIAEFQRVWRNHCAASHTSAPILIVLDTTLLGAQFPLEELLEGLVGSKAPTLITVRSGMRLDQAGLELANVGIVSVYRPESEIAHTKQIADRLRTIRSSTGVGLTLDETAALDAPWFLDRDHAKHYAKAVFQNNALLAAALSNSHQLFRQVLYPNFADASSLWAKAPYSVLRLREPSAENYDTLARIIAYECAHRNLLFDRGGGFGLRGHRYDIITPATEACEPFLRIAMGARDGPSCDGIIKLLQELASCECISDLRANYLNVRCSLH